MKLHLQYRFILLVTTLLVIVPVDKVSGVVCYKCSYGTTGCSDPFDKSSNEVTIDVETYNHTCDFCYKAKATSGSDVIRKCADDGLTRQGCYSGRHQSDLVTECLCMRDYCNNAHMIRINFSCLIVMFVLQFLDTMQLY